MTYTDLWDIVTKAQKGSGYTKSKETARAKTVLTSLAQKGWNKTHLKTAFHNLDDTLLTGWPEDLFQESYMKETTPVLNSLQASFLAAGVNPTRVRDVLCVLGPLNNTRYTNKQLLDVGIEYLLGRYKPIAPPSAAHFLQPDTLNTWIPLEKKPIMNVTYSCRYTAAQRFETQVRGLFPKEGGDVYFHTTNWGSALNILQFINVAKSRMCLDFNYKPSFYVSESVQDAIDWGVKNKGLWSDEIAIILFQVPRDFHKDFEFKDLTMDAKEWEWVVSTFRDCGELPDALEYDDTHDFVYGPMLSNPQTYNKVGPLQHRPPIMQLAAKTREATRFLYKCMKGAFIFRKIHGSAA